MIEQLYLFARIAGTRIAVRSHEIEAVVKLADIAPVPAMPLHIAGLSALRSRVLTVIDVAALIEGRVTSADAGRLAIVADIAGHSYGFMVDSVSDICTTPGGELPLRGQLAPCWAAYARGIVEDNDGPSILVTLGAFIEPRQLPVAA